MPITEGEAREPNEEEDVIDLSKTEDESLLNALEDEDSDTDDKGQAPEEEASDEPADEEVPEKFRGKSRKEIAEIYANLEREHGRRMNELGELRKVTDDILRTQLAPATADEDEDEISPDDFLKDPASAVRKLVSESPEVKEARDSKAKAAREESLARLKGDHPDFTKVANSAAFSEWLNKFPSRAQRWFNADAQLDFDTANEMLSTFKEIYTVAKEEAEEKRGEDLNNLKSAPARSSSTGKKKKIFLRSELMKLKQTDPDRYDRLQPAILQAYAEGRVK